MLLVDIQGAGYGQEHRYCDNKDNKDVWVDAIVGLEPIAGGIGMFCDCPLTLLLLLHQGAEVGLPILCMDLTSFHPSNLSHSLHDVADVCR